MLFYKKFAFWIFPGSPFWVKSNGLMIMRGYSIKLFHITRACRGISRGLHRFSETSQGYWTGITSQHTRIKQSRFMNNKWLSKLKPDIFAHKLNLILLPQLIPTLNSYACSLPPLAKVDWSAFPECFLLTM